MDRNLGDFDARNRALIKWLTCLMFLMFAMTSDAVGSVIPHLIKEFGLSLTAAGTFHYVPMAAIAFGAIAFGFMADKLGRQPTIVVGLLLYGASSVMFAFGSSFSYFVALLAVSGLGVSIFKTGALAVVGDITTSTKEHSSLMNTVEGFFATGAIIGPAIVATLLATEFSWKWLYVAAAAICAVLIAVSLCVRYPTLNSKGISCFRKSEHGAAAGVILFFTAVAAALGPLAMGAISDTFGGVQYGFWLATGFSCLLFVGLVANLVLDPSKRRLQEFEQLESEAAAP